MNVKFTEQIKKWLDDSQHDLKAGAEMILQLSNNQVRHKYILAQIRAKSPDIEGFIVAELKKYYNLRLQKVTHEQVVVMERKAKNIVAKLPQKISGKRVDHDALPENVQALYVENASILRKIRLLHLKLSEIQTQKVSCPDSEKYPFVKEIIRMDKQYHENWHTYDTWTQASGEDVLLAERRAMSVKALRFVNLNKGRYKKYPSESLLAKLREQYANIVAPSDNLKKEMKEIGVI